MNIKNIVFIMAIASNVNNYCALSFVLITTLYNESDKARAQEYITCLEKNLLHPLIDTIHILYDTSKDDDKCELLAYLRSKPIHISYINRRATYGDCFVLANVTYSKRAIIVSNADIYFNETLCMLDGIDLTNTFLALTRWNEMPDGSLEIFKQYSRKGVFLKQCSEQSQDTWIFKAPLKKFVKDDLCLGLQGCDTAIAGYAYESGLHVLNPCLSIQCCHLHLTQKKNYDMRKRTYVNKSSLTAVPWITLEDIKNLRK